MNPLTVVACLCLLGLVLWLLGAWQRRITEGEEEGVLAEIQAAREGGTDKPLAQHPLIDVQSCIGCGSCIAACPEDGVLGLVDGVARVIHGSRCIGHARCATACPVAAIGVGLGELALSPDLPLLTPQLETSVPGIYIAGELSGFALIRVAVEQGVRAVEAIASDLGRRAPPRAGDPLDLLIVGTGPAGLAASLAATERGLRYAAIDQDDVGGTVRKYPRRKLTLTGTLDLPLHGRLDREELLKEELIELWESLIREHHLHIRSGVKLSGVRREGELFVASTSQGEARARRVLLALGRRGTPRRLGVPGEESERVLYQLVDAAGYSGMSLLVVGGGDSAVEAATALASQPGNAVTLAYRRGSFFRLKSRNDERIRRFQREGKVHVLFNSQVARIDEGSVLIASTEEGVERTRTLASDFVLVCAGGEPPRALLRGMGIRMNGDGAAGPAEVPHLAAAGTEGAP